MTEKLELYKCEICGNLVQVILNGIGELVCCGKEMKKLIANEEANNIELAEKHTPVIEIEGENKFVRLNYHPMSEEHYIQFIEAYTKDKSELHLKYLNPNEKAEFNITGFGESIDALEHCNIHGLWKNKD